MALDKIVVGRRELWARCRRTRNHDGLHHDQKFPSHYWEETVFEGDFERGKVKVPLKRKVRTCKRCSKPIRTDGSPDACVCKEIGNNTRQSILFVDERERAHADAMANDLDNDIAWLIAESDKKRLKMIAESDVPYYGDF